MWKGRAEHWEHHMHERILKEMPSPQRGRGGGGEWWISLYLGGDSSLPEKSAWVGEGIST